MRAIEFFSGIGAFAEATRDCDIEVVAAFDQNSAANAVYAHNFSLPPGNRNLDTIKLDDIPLADLWWMSPPCTPFSVRGKQRGLADPRAASLLNLISLASVALPKYILIENVLGFKDSPAAAQAKLQLAPLGYTFASHDLCSTHFGIPMRRPRHFLIACRAAEFQPAPTSSGAKPVIKKLLRDFLFDDSADLFLTPAIISRYEQGFDLVDPCEADAELICFTKNYERCMRASGSLIRTKAGTRRISPEEILKLLGFSERFSFPDQVSRALRWRMVGNSVDVRAIMFILASIGISASETLLVERY